MSDFKVIILTNDTLKGIGLRSIFETAFGINAYIADEHYFDNFSSSKEPHLFFVDSTTLVANLGFFIPRKAKTVLLTLKNTHNEDFKTLCINDSESDIINHINAFFVGSNEDEKNSTNTLSQREIEVLRLIASGKINKEIAKELNISINTVLSHRKNLTAKLGIKSISVLTFYAMMNGTV